MAIIGSGDRRVSEYQRQIVIASIVGVVIVLSVGIGIYMSPLQNNPPVSSTSSTSSFSTFYASTSSTGSSISYNNATIANLNLAVSLNSTTMNANGAISINASETNLENYPLNVTANKAWHDDIAAGKDMPNTAYFPINVEFFAGYYTGDNFSSATPLVFSIYARDVVCCDQTPDEYFLFDPLSSHAYLIQNSTYTSGSPKCPGSCLGPDNLSVSYNLELAQCCYYNNPYTNTTSFPLSPGKYTVEVYDMWGRVVLAHFTVTGLYTATTTSESNTQRTTTTSVSALS